MPILRYVWSIIDGLLDPKGSLSKKLRPWKIDEANYQVQVVQVHVAEGGKKRGPYNNKYSDEERAATRRYAYQHATFTAARYFSRKLGKFVSEGTVKSMKKTYTQELTKRPRGQSYLELEHLPPKNRERKVLLGSYIDSKLQAYVSKAREGGVAVNAKIVVAGAKGTCTCTCNHSFLAEYGGSISLTHTWAHALLRWMNYVWSISSRFRVVVSTSMSTFKCPWWPWTWGWVFWVWSSKEIKAQLLKAKARRTFVKVEGWITGRSKDYCDDGGCSCRACHELGLNRSENSLSIILNNGEMWSKESRNCRWKWQMSDHGSIFCSTMLGDFFLILQLVYCRKTDRCHSKF